MVAAAIVSVAPFPEMIRVCRNRIAVCCFCRACCCRYGHDCCGAGRNSVITDRVGLRIADGSLDGLVCIGADLELHVGQRAIQQIQAVVLGVLRRFG